MPIYEYACPKCRVIFNFLSKRIKPDRLPVCPKCGNNPVLFELTVVEAMPGSLRELVVFRVKAPFHSVMFPTAPPP